MEYFVANISGKARREKVGNREYLVAPISLIVPGILNGSKGPLLYRQNDVRKSAPDWEGIPIVVEHPTRNGIPVQANGDDEVLAEFGVGELRNSRFADGKLKADGWFDVERTKKVNQQVYDALVNGQAMEVSTGLGTTNEAVPEGATWQGHPYVAIARDYSPDHLAVLPGQRGACSLRDGCGLMVNAANEAGQVDQISAEECVDRMLRYYLSGGSMSRTDVLNAVTSSPAYEIVDHLPDLTTLWSFERVVVGNASKFKIVRLAPDQVGNCDETGECEECKKKRLAKQKKPKYPEEVDNSAIDDGSCKVSRNGKVEDCKALFNQMSHSDLREQLANLVNRRFGVVPGGYTSAPMVMTTYVVDVYDKEFIYERGGKLFRLGYTTDLRNDSVNISDAEPVEVKRVTQYKSVNNHLLLERLGSKLGIRPATANADDPQTALLGRLRSAKAHRNMASATSDASERRRHVEAATAHEETAAKFMLGRRKLI